MQTEKKGEGNEKSELVVLIPFSNVADLLRKSLQMYFVDLYMFSFKDCVSTVRNTICVYLIEIMKIFIEKALNHCSSFH